MSAVGEVAQTSIKDNGQRWRRRWVFHENRILHAVQKREIALATNDNASDLQILRSLNYPANRSRLASHSLSGRRAIDARLDFAHDCALITTSSNATSARSDLSRQDSKFWSNGFLVMRYLVCPAPHIRSFVRQGLLPPGALRVFLA